MSGHPRGVDKEAKDLARRVNAIEGWTADLVKGGAHGGIAYVVRENGEYRCRFSGQPSVPFLAFARAEAEIRRLGCPLPHKGITPKKEEAMAAPTADERRESDALRPRIVAAIKDLGGDQNEFIRRSVEIIGESGFEQFGTGKSSSAREIVAATLPRFLDGGSLKQLNLDRFTHVIDQLNGSAPPKAEAEPEPDEPAAAGPEPFAEEPEPKPEPRPATATPADDLGQLAEEQQLRKLAEDTVAEVERERDSALKKAEQAETSRLSLVEQIKALEAEAKDRLPAAELESVLADTREQLVAAQDAEQEANQLLALAEAENAELEAKVIEKARLKIRASYADALLEALGQVDGTPGEWLLGRLDSLAEIPAARGGK